MQHKAEDSVVVMFAAFCKRCNNVLAVVGDHAACCLQHVQHCCVQCACTSEDCKLPYHVCVDNLNQELRGRSAEILWALICRWHSTQELLTLQVACDMALTWLGTCGEPLLRQVIHIALQLYLLQNHSMDIFADHDWHIYWQSMRYSPEIVHENVSRCG